MEIVIAPVVALVVGFGLGYWVKGRGVAGIKADLADAQAQVDKLKAKAGV